MSKSQRSYRFLNKFVIFIAILAFVSVNSRISAQDVSVASNIPESTDSKDEQIAKGKGLIAQGEVSGKIQNKDGVSPELVTAGTYAFTSGTGVALEDMSTGTTQLVAAGSDDGNSALSNIGFEYWYDGVRFTQFGVNANGFVRLGAVPASGTPWVNSTNFASTVDAPKMAPFWDDLCVGTTGKIHFKTIGVAPNRKLVVEFQNMQITRGATCAGVGGGTFQMWLFESAAASGPGVIEFVYGPGMVATNAADGGYSIGLQSGAATNFASVTTSSNTVSYAVANNTQSNAITAGRSYLFTPNIPAAPSGMTFAPVTPTSIQVNWTDNSSNEAGFAVFRSTDNVNFTFASQTAAGATSFNDTALTPLTTYFYRVLAVSEGALSGVLAGSQATSAPGNDSCNGAGGNWSSNATWTDGSVPTVNDNVTIGSGCTVTVDVTTAVAINVTVNSGGTLQSPTTGAVTNNNLTVTGNVTNNGTLDFSTNANTSGAILTFGGGGANVTFGGTGATTDVRAITIAKGAQAPVVELSTTNFTVQGVNTDVAGFVTLTSGTFKISSNFTMTNRVFTTASYVIPTAGGIWLNNANFTVAGTASSTTSGSNGLFRLTQGVYNIGLTAADGFDLSVTTAVYIIEGGTLNAAGRFDPQGTVTYTQTGGTVNCATVGNNRSAFGSFEIFGTTSTFNMSGGTINLINPATGATKDDYTMTAATQTITGGLVVFGGPGAPPNSTYNSPFGTTFIPNFIVPAGMTYSSGATVFFRGTAITNNGAMAGTTAARFDFANANAAMTYSGPGTFGTALAPWAGSIGANSTFFTTLNSNMVVARVNLFQAGFINSNRITLGNGGASTTIVQIGSTGLTTAGGSFDVSPVHSQGTGGEIVLYAFETAPRTTGFEINPTRILASINLVDNTNNVTISGGDLTLSSAAAALVLTSGRLITGANNLILSSGTATVTRTAGYVDGNFRKTYAAAGSKSFEVGTANGFSPVTVNVTAGTFPATFTAKAVQGAQPNIPNPGKALSRYWPLAGSGVTSADLTFNYLDPTDIPGTATEANFIIQKFSGTFSQPGGTVNTAANTATINGVSSFSDWTLADPVALLTPEMNVKGNNVSIVDGDVTPSLADFTDFGSVNINAATLARTYTIENTGTATLNLGAVTLSGANASNFTVTGTPAATVAPGGSTNVQVTFDPSATGLRTATLNIANDDLDENPYDFAIQGTGIVQEINVKGNGVNIVDGSNTPSLGDGSDFSTALVVGGTVFRTFTIENTGTATLNVATITFSGNNFNEFTVTSPPAATVAPGGSTTFQVKFDPNGSGLRVARLNIVNDDSDENPYDFAIQGTGVISNYQFSAATYIGDESKFATVTITRTGDTSGPGTVNFSTAPGGSATPGSCGTLNVDYVAVVSQLVLFNTNSASQTATVQLCPDALIESQETINVALSSPDSNSGLGSQSTAVITINDTASQFFNPAPISIFVGQIANPYPSTINVVNGPPVVGSLRVTLYGVRLDQPPNMDVLLVSPNGRQYILTADTGGPLAMVNPVTLTLQDSPTQVLPCGADFVTGLFRPTSCIPGQSAFPGPAPAPNPGPNYNEPGTSTGARTTLQTLNGVFGGINANGPWNLYIRDDSGSFAVVTGEIAGGWGLQFFNPTAVSNSSIAGRVTTSGGQGIRNATVTLTGGSIMAPLVMQTGSMGMFRFEDLHAGDTYVVTVNAKRYTFSMPSRVVTLTDSLTDFDFASDQ